MHQVGLMLGRIATDYYYIIIITLKSQD